MYFSMYSIAIVLAREFSISLDATASKRFTTSAILLADAVHVEFVPPVGFATTPNRVRVSGKIFEPVLKFVQD